MVVVLLVHAHQILWSLVGWKLLLPSQLVLRSWKRSRVWEEEMVSWFKGYGQGVGLWRGNGIMIRGLFPTFMLSAIMNIVFHRIKNVLGDSHHYNLKGFGEFTSLLLSISVSKLELTFHFLQRGTRKGKEERKGNERKRKERKWKERKGKERKMINTTTCDKDGAWGGG